MTHAERLSDSAPPWTAPPGEDVARAVGRHLACSVHGDPSLPPVLFLHGITGSRHYWDPAPSRLASSRRLVVPDLMGFGESPKPALRYDMSSFVASIRGLVVHLGLDRGPLDVVAHSLGGLIALEYAVRHPGHLRRVVAVSLPCYRDRHEAHAVFLEGSANYRRLIGKASLWATLRSWRRAGPLMAARYALAFSPRIASDSRSWTFHSLTSTLEHCLLGHRVQDTAERLAQLRGSERPSLLLIHGSRDQVAPMRRVRDLLPSLPDASLTVLDGTGHHPFRTHAARCLDIMGSFLPVRVDG